MPSDVPRPQQRDLRAAKVLKVVSLADLNPLTRLLRNTLIEMFKRYDKPLHFTHVCAPPAPILLSDLVFADYFMCRDPRPEVYAPWLSALSDIRGASCLIVDDASLLLWPRVMVYPRISHDFRRHPEADLLCFRWARYTSNHHQIPFDLVDGRSLNPEAVNLHLERLSEYLGVPIIRIAYGNNHQDITRDWEVQGDGNVNHIPTARYETIDQEKMVREFTSAMDKIAAHSPVRGGDNKSYLNTVDQPHWCGWLINKQLLDLILSHFNDIVALGRPSSVPYLLNEATRRGKRVRYRLDLTVPPDCDCVLQVGVMRRPETDKPIFQIMHAGWTPTATNLPPALAEINLPPSKVIPSDGQIGGGDDLNAAEIDRFIDDAVMAANDLRMEF